MFFTPRFKSVVNQALPTLQEESLEVTQTVPLKTRNALRQKFNFVFTFFPPTFLGPLLLLDPLLPLLDLLLDLRRREPDRDRRLRDLDLDLDLDLLPDLEADLCLFRNRFLKIFIFNIMS